MEKAQTNIQSELNNLTKWTKRKGFTISLEKNDSHAHIQEKKPRTPRPTNKIERTDPRIEEHPQNLGITFDNRLTWKAHITEAKAKSAKRMNVLRSLVGTNWEADQGMLLRIHEMFMLSAHEYGSIAYGSATDGQ
jgi:hypothetical protein